MKAKNGMFVKENKDGRKRREAVGGQEVSGSDHGTDTRECVTRKTVRLYTYCLLIKSGRK